MGDIAEAFEQHLKSLSDEDWTKLVQRVRPSKQVAPGDAGRAAADKRFNDRSKR